ncbi:MAG: hypothetical protein ACKPKO_05940, partial [Candidatus Fonsibacter sp.]
METRGREVLFVCPTHKRDGRDGQKPLHSEPVCGEVSEKKGFRYINELLMQGHNFYLNSSYKLE